MNDADNIDRDPWDYRHPVLSSCLFAAIVVGLVAAVVADHMNQKKETSLKAKCHPTKNNPCVIRANDPAEAIPEPKAWAKAVTK